MRSATLLAILALGVAAIAKEPAPKPSQSRSQQLLGPIDQGRVFNMEQLTPFGRSKSEFRAKEAQSNSFYIHQKYNPKGYDTKSFSTKSSRYNDFKFATKSADTKTYETKAAPTKAASVKDAREATKSAPTREFADANRTSGFKGRNQALFDKEGPAAQAKVGAGWRTQVGDGRFSIPGGPENASWGGNLKVLTVDDVREILNKNK